MLLLALPILSQLDMHRGRADAEAFEATLAEARVALESESEWEREGEGVESEREA